MPTKKEGWYTLTLKDVSKSILWFTDRPVRKSGTVSNTDFLKDWDTNKADNFTDDNPNASLVAFFQ